MIVPEFRVFRFLQEDLIRLIRCGSVAGPVRGVCFVCLLFLFINEPASSTVHNVSSPLALVACFMLEAASYKYKDLVGRHQNTHAAEVQL